MCMKTSQDGFGSRILFRIEGRTTSGKDLSSPKKRSAQDSDVAVVVCALFLFTSIFASIAIIIFAMFDEKTTPRKRKQAYLSIQNSILSTAL